MNSGDGEMIRFSDATVERFARVMCEANNQDPDIHWPTWKAQALAFLAAEREHILRPVLKTDLLPVGV